MDSDMTLFTILFTLFGHCPLHSLLFQALVGHPCSIFKLKQWRIWGACSTKPPPSIEEYYWKIARRNPHSLSGSPIVYSLISDTRSCRNVYTRLTMKSLAWSIISGPMTLDASGRGPWHEHWTILSPQSTQSRRQSTYVIGNLPYTITKATNLAKW